MQIAEEIAKAETLQTQLLRTRLSCTYFSAMLNGDPQQVEIELEDLSIVVQKLISNIGDG